MLPYILPLNLVLLEHLMSFIQIQQNIETNKEKQPFQLVALSKNQGKILKIDQNYFPNLIVRGDTILALKSPEFTLNKQDKNIPKTLQYVKWFKNTIPTQNLLIKQICDLYLQTENIIIEKNLGENECIQVKFDNIIAFSESITFKIPQYKKSFFQFPKLEIQQFYKQMLILKGPGIVMLENQQKTVKNLDKNQAEHQEQKYALFIFFMLYLLYFVLLKIYEFEELFNFND